MHEKIDISQSEYHVEFNELNEKFELFRDDEHLKTPFGSIVKHHNRRLLEHIQAELECRDVLDVTELTTYSMYSTYTDFLVEKGCKFSKKEVRMWILGDSVLRSCSGPEQIYQYSQWNALFQLLEEFDVSYPGLIQVPEIENIEEWISTDTSEEYQNNFNRLVDRMYEEFSLLSKEQMTVVVTAVNCHNTFSYGLILATKKCTELEYAIAILAGMCVLPWVFADCSRSEYKEIFDELIADSNMLTNFIRFSLSPNQNTIEFLKNKLPKFGFIPESGKWALLEAVKRIHAADSDDYSPYVVLLGKALEVSMKELFFDEFRKRYKSEIVDQREVQVFTKDNEKIKKLTTFLEKEPHFIELGSMLTVLKLYGGKTSRRNQVLGKFFNFIVNEKQAEAILSDDFIDLAFEISKQRNNAAHSRRFGLEESKELLNKSLKSLSKVA